MSRKAEFLSTIKPILDKKEAKRDAIELAKELSDVLGGIDIDADGSGFNELKEIFNAQLVEMGKQPIVFSESTLKGITAQFANAISEGIKAGVAKGGKIIGVEVSTKDAKKQSLLDEKTQLQKDIANLEKHKQRLNTIMPPAEVNDESISKRDAEQNNMSRQEKAFHAYQGFKDKDTDTIRKEVKDAVNAYSQLVFDIGDMSADMDGYEEKVLDAVDALTTLYEMREKLNSSKEPERRAIASKYLSISNLEDMSFIHDTDDGDSVFLQDIAQEILDKFPLTTSGEIDIKSTRLKEIEQELLSLEAQADNTADKMQEVNKALDSRLRKGESAGSKNIKPSALQNAQDALGYTYFKDDGKPKATLATLYNQYETSETGDFVDRYQALLKFTSAYQQYESSLSEDEKATDRVLKKYKEKYQNLSQYIDDARQALTLFLDTADARKHSSGTTIASGSPNTPINTHVVNAAEKEKKAKEATANASKSSLEYEKEKLQIVENLTNEYDEQIRLSLQQGERRETAGHIDSKTGRVDRFVVGGQYGVAIPGGVVEDYSFFGGKKPHSDIGVHSHWTNAAAPSPFVDGATEEGDLHRFKERLSYQSLEIIRAMEEWLYLDFSKIKDTALNTLIEEYDRIGAQIHQYYLDMPMSERLRNFGSTDVSEREQVALRSAFSKLASPYEGFATWVKEPVWPDPTHNIGNVESIDVKNKVAQDTTKNIEKTIDLLNKEKLTYEDILTLVKSYNDEAQMKAAADAGDWDTYDKIFAHHTDIARKLVPTNMMGIGSDSPDNWLAMVGMSAEDAAQKLKDLYDRTHDIASIDGDEDDDIRRENGALEEKLELLRDIAEQYGNNITQKKRDRHEELNQKDMDSGLTPKEDERYWELGEEISEADEALLAFEETYERITIKLANGKKVEILPDDKGLRSLYEFADGYGDEFKGVEIEDVVFERAKKEAAAIEDVKQAQDGLNDSLRERQELGDAGTNTSEVDNLRQQLDAANKRASDAEELAKSERIEKEIAEEALSNTYGSLWEEEQRAKDAEEEVARLQQELAERQHISDGTLDGDGAGTEASQMTSLKEAVEAVTTAVGLKTKAFQDEQTAVDQVVTGEIESLGRLEEKIKDIKSIFEGLVNNIRNGSDDIGAGLSNVSINVNYPDNSQTTLDQDALNRLAEVIKSAQTKTPETAIDVTGKALATENTLLAIKTAVESINNKTVKGTRVGTGAGRKSTTMSDYTGSPFFGEKLETRKMELEKFVQQLMNRNRNTESTRKNVKILKDNLDKVSSGEQLSVWDQKFRQLKISEGIYDLQHKSDKESVETYKNLIAYAKEYYSIVEKHEKAKENTQRKAILAQQKQDAETFMSNGGLNLDTIELGDEAYNKKLSDLRTRHKRNLEVIRADKSDKTNAQDIKEEAKIRAEALTAEEKEVNKLADAYKILGKLIAERKYATLPEEKDAIQAIINKHVKDINANQYNTASRFDMLRGVARASQVQAEEGLSRKAAKKTGTDRLRDETKAENDALRDQKQVVNELIDLYKQLGHAEAKRDMTSQNIAQAAMADDEYDAIQKEIDAKRKLIKIDDKLENQFTDSWMSGIEAETKKPIGNLTKAMQELGELRAKIDQTPDGDYLNFLKRQFALKSKLLAVESDRLGLSQDEKESNRQIAEDAYDASMVKWQGELAKKRDKERNDEQDKLFKKQIKQSKELAKISKTKSAIDKGDNIVASASSISGWSDEQIARLNEYSSKLTELKDKYTEIRYSDGVISPAQQKEVIDQTADVNSLTKEIGELIAEYNRLSGEHVTELGANTLGNNASLDEKKQKLIELAMAYGNGKTAVKKYDAATGELTVEINTGKYEVTEYTFALRRLGDQFVAVQGATKKLETPIEKLKRKMSEILTYFGGSSLIYEGIAQVRQGIQYVRDIDLALTELKKVTDETEESYDRFLETASKTANKVGSTITNIVSSTADWARLGYNMEDAANLAESTSVLLNVSEFSSIEDATSALTSTMQAFGYVAEDSMHVVDVMNIIGNNFAVSTDGLAVALQDSASALMAANNSYEEAVSLVAAANRVVQDPNSVGAALRTISLRLRGTSVKELEESGEDTTGVITSKSKLRSKIKSLSGVDILTDTGAYKSTYEILLEISKVWKDMSDVDQAALLEILAGKNRANTAMAILSNTTDLEDAYVKALEAEGSALKENEKYLDSIQGKIDLFNNSVQTMWSNTLDDDLVNGFVALGTELIKLIDKIGLVNVVISGFGLYKIIPWLIKLITDTDKFGAGLKKLLSPLVKVDGTGRSVADMFMFVYKNAAKSTGGITNLGAALKAAKVALSAFTKTPLGWLTVAAAVIGGVVLAIDHFTTSAKEAAEASREALSDYESAQDNLKSQKKTIESISEDYKKLSNGVDEFGNNISLSTDEYERYNEIVNQIEDMFPQMVSGYNAEGKAIIAHKGNVDALTQAYEAEAQAARDALLVSSKDIFKNFKNNTSKATWSNVAKTEQLGYLETMINNPEQAKKDWNSQGTAPGTYRQLLKAAGVDYSIWDDGDDLKDILANKENKEKILAYYRTLKTEIEAEVAPVKSFINAYLSNSTDYKKLSEEGKNIAQSILSGFDTEFYSRFNSDTEAEAWIVANLIKPLQDLDNLGEFEAAFNFQTKFNNNEISAADYQTAISEFIQTLKELGFDEDIVKTVTLVFGIEDLTPKINRAKDLLEDQYDDKADSLTKEDLDIIDKYASAWDVDEDTLYSWDELLQKIAEAKSVAEDTSITSSLSQISAIESAFNSLGEAMQEFKEDGTASAGTLEDINEAFKDIDGFEELYKVLATGEGDIATAMTNVANAYLIQQGALSNLSSEERKIMIARLESLGVINARQLVETRQTAQEEINTRLQGYNIDLSAYATAEAAKLAIAQQTKIDTSSIVGDTIEDLETKYGMDLSAYASVEAAKVAIAKKTAKSTAKAQQQEQLSALDAEYAEKGYAGNEKYRSSEYKTQRQAINDAYQTTIAEINAIDENAFADINSFVESYYNTIAKFDFSGKQTGIGRDFDKDIDTDSDKKASDALDKLRKQYENKISLLENQQTYLENEIEKAEAEDRQVGRAVYDAQINIEKKKLEELRQERAALLKAMENVPKESDVWHDYANAVWETEHAIQESSLAIVDFQQKITDLYVEVFDKIEEAYGNLEDLRQYQQDAINNEIEYAELTDQPISADYYKKLIDVQKKDYADKLAEANSLRYTLDLGLADGSIKEGTQEWAELQKRIYAADLDAQEARNTIEETNNEMKQLYVTAFEKVGEAYDALDSLYSDRRSYTEGYMELEELRGNSVSTGAYDYLIENETNSLNANIQKLADQEAKLQNAMANGIKKGSEEWIQMNEEIRATEAAIQDNYIALEQYNEELKSLYSEAFNKVRDSFGDVTDIYDDQQAFVESYISYLETLGIDVPAEMYDKLSGIELDKQEANMRKLADMQDALAKMEAEGYTPEDEEWVQAKADIRAVEKAIWDSEVAMAEYNKRVREMETEKFEEYAKRIGDVVDELERLNNLFSDEDVATEDGAWTEEGIASLGLTYQKMEIAKKQIADYQEEIEKLNDEYKSGAISEQEYNDRLVELKNSQWDAIESYESAKDAIVDINEARIDMIEEGINKEIEAYQELIDLKKDELDAERDLYEFRKNIKNQTRDIASLERRIAAMSGSTDTATIAERTKLEQQLREAREGLDDTYYTHAMDSQSTALDDENEAYVKSKEDYVELLREALEDVESIVANTMSQVLINADTVLGTLNGVSGEYGITLSESLTSPWISAAQQAEAFKNSAIMQEYDFAMQNDIFTGEITAAFSDLFVKTTIMATNFQTSMYTVMEAVRITVNTATSGMKTDMLIPFERALTYAQETFSPQTIAELDAVANKAASLVYDETDNLTSPWHDGVTAAHTYGEKAKEVLKQVYQDATDYDPSVPIESNLLNAQGKFDLFGTHVGSVFTGMADDAVDKASKIGTEMQNIVKAAQDAQDALNGVGSNGGGGGEETTTPPSTPPPTKKEHGGTSGSLDYSPSDVKSLQTCLNMLFSTGLQVDGKMGPATKTAIMKVQKYLYTYGIESMKSQDGLYGATTKRAIESYINSKISSLREQGGSSMIGQAIQRYNTIKSMLPKAFYAKGTTGTNRDEWAITDELGDELVMYATPQGTLSYMRAGSTVVPADLTKNLMEWGKLNPNMDMSGAVQGVNLMTNVISKPEVNLSFDALVKAEHITEETLPAVKKLVTEELEKFSRSLNYSLRRVGAK